MRFNDGAAGHPLWAPVRKWLGQGSPRQGLPRRRSIRLKGYDYSSAGAYFVTICTQNQEFLFGEIAVGAGPRACPEMILNDAGQMVADVLQQIPDYYPGNDIDECVVMPNHIHAIIIVGAGPCACPDDRQPQTNHGQLQTDHGQPQGVAPTGLSLPDIVNRIKTMTTKRYADGVKQSNWRPFNARLWQRNYYEHVARNEDDLNRIREYISNNPMNWETDDLFTRVVK